MKRKYTGCYFLGQVARKVYLFYLVALAVIFFCWLVPAVPATGQNLAQAKPLEQGHSHNDYWRTNPLTDALRLGFKSVEADVFLVDGALLVGHSVQELQPRLTLESLYLVPLQALMQKNKGLYRKAGILYLYIDFKTEGKATYEQLVPVLQKYEDMLVTPHNSRKKRGVQVILTGNYPREQVLADAHRLVYLDGKVEELAGKLEATYFPVVSGNWASSFKWRGEGKMPPAEEKLLHEWHNLAQQNGQRIRFWNISETNPGQTKAIWQELLKYKTMLIGTDHLDWLVQMLEKQK